MHLTGPGRWPGGLSVGEVPQEGAERPQRAAGAQPGATSLMLATWSGPYQEPRTRLVSAEAD